MIRSAAVRMCCNWISRVICLKGRSAKSIKDEKCWKKWAGRKARGLVKRELEWKTRWAGLFHTHNRRGKKKTTLSWHSLSFSRQIELKIRTSQSGLGSGATLSVDSMSVNKSKSQKNWEKARERYADAFQPDAPAPIAQNSASPKAWVRAEDTIALAELDSEGWSQEWAP